MNNNIKWRIIFSLLLSKMTDTLLSAKTTLPTLLSAVGAPVWMVSFLVPLRESGSLLPQALMGAWLEGKTQRGRIWLNSMLVQTICIVIMIFVPLSILPIVLNVNSQAYSTISAYIILISLLAISVARAMTSLTMKDIQGKHLEKGKRGNVVGISATLAGVLSLTFASYTIFVGKLDEDILLSIGIVCFVAMTLSLLSLKPLNTYVAQRQRTEGDKNSTYLAFKDKCKRYVATFSGDLGRFILVRSCFVHTALIAPFFIVWATDTFAQKPWVTLSSFIFAQGAASLSSAYVWGGLSDRSAKRAMQLGALLVAIVCLIIIICIYFKLVPLIPSIALVTLYFLIAIGHEGARSGRKVYALDINEGMDRTDFISKANTSIGVVILLLGIVYSLLSTIGMLTLFASMLVFLLLGLLLSATMSEEK